MLLLSVVIVAIAVLLFYVRRETYVDIRHTREQVLNLIDNAEKQGGFTKSEIERLEKMLEPIMKRNKKILNSVIDYANQDRFRDTREIVDLYFSPMKR
jgi:uncharacterized protein YoxC